MSTDTEGMTWAARMVAPWVDPVALEGVTAGTEAAEDLARAVLDAEVEAAEADAAYAGTEDRADAVAWVLALRSARGQVGTAARRDRVADGWTVLEAVATFPDGSRWRLQAMPDGTATGAYAVDGQPYAVEAVADALDAYRERLEAAATGTPTERQAAAWAYAEALEVLGDLEPRDAATRVADAVAWAWAEAMAAAVQRVAFAAGEAARTDALAAAADALAMAGRVAAEVAA